MSEKITQDYVPSDRAVKLIELQELELSNFDLRENKDDLLLHTESADKLDGRSVYYNYLKSLGLKTGYVVIFKESSKTISQVFRAIELV